LRIAPRWAGLALVAACGPGAGDPGRPAAPRRPAAEQDPRPVEVAADDGGFRRMPPPRPGEWLHRFPERGRTFEQYRRSRPVRAVPGRDVLAFLPVGDFTEAGRAVMRATIDFAGIWLDLPTRVLEGEALPGDGWRRRRRFPWAERPVFQHGTGYFLRDLLPPRRPDDAACLMGVTMADLYPEPSWNYVFGQASLRRRVGIYSIARHFASFWGKRETDATRLHALRRSCKLVTHEAGHTFGLQHCVDYECNMNGSNSLEESDRRPLRLCPPCLRKLQWNRGFDVRARYRRLLAFYRGHGLGPEARWTAARLLRTAH
ncbi:MAG: archaemetzincin, partial [Planctomycetota bacterium]